MKIILTDNNGSYHDLNFEIFDSSIASRWIDEVKRYINNAQPIDDRERFYNFPNSKFTEEYINDYLNQLIDIINSYTPGLITKSAYKGMSQDMMNYLHHIFEVYHGLFDQQDTNEFFSKAPPQVQKALSDLNIWIHRYETLGDIPRFVATWYGNQRKLLLEDDYKEFSIAEEWGDLKINYCEVGKTLYDLYHDNDQYIDPDAFRPLKFYSFDFTVRFTDKDSLYYQTIEKEVWEYFDKNSKFFNDLGYTRNDPKLSLGWITVGRLINTDSKEKMIKQISLHQNIHSIEI